MGMGVFSCRTVVKNFRAVKQRSKCKGYSLGAALWITLSAACILDHAAAFCNESSDQLKLFVV